MKYSIITSAYNQKDYLITLRHALDSQTYKDFEWIIADDGSLDGTSRWAQENHVDNYVFQENKGYRLSLILNKAAALAKGEYLVFIMGDSYPKEDFLEELDKVVRPERLVNGIRMNVSDSGKIISPDWRMQAYESTDAFDEMKVVFPEPWRSMTLNSLCVPKRIWDKIGGMCEEYTNYGKEDWDLVMRAFFDGAELWWSMKAVIYHHDHPGKVDDEENTKLFFKRLEEFREKWNERTKGKMDLIRSEARAMAKKELIQKKLRDAALAEKAMDREDRESV